MPTTDSTWKTAFRQTVLTPTDAPPLPELPGYELLGVLGAGGMGLIYRARQIGVQRFVAIKILTTNAHADPDARDRFRREALSIGRVSHPNVVVLHDFVEHNGRQFLVMELVEGPTLANYAATHTVRPLEAIAIVEQVAHGVDVAHRAGIVHRDLKPGNILMAVTTGPIVGAIRVGDAWMVPKVADFGLAKLLEGHGDLTADGNVVGTPKFMAPEQMEAGTTVTPAADVYSLGAILYQLLVGKAPFEESDIFKLQQAALLRPPVRPGSLQPGISRDMDAIVLRCLAKSPADRYGSAGELGDDLRRLLQGRPVLARRPSPWTNGLRLARRNPLCAVLLMGLVTAVIGGLTRTWQLSNRAEREHVRAIEERRAAELARQEAERLAEVARAEHHAAILEQARADAVDRYLFDEVMIPAIRAGVKPDAKLSAFVDVLAKIPPDKLADAPQSAFDVQLALATHYAVRLDFRRALEHIGHAIRFGDKAFGACHPKSVDARKSQMVWLGMAGETDLLDREAIRLGMICESSKSQRHDTLEVWNYCFATLMSNYRFGAAIECLDRAIACAEQARPTDRQKVEKMQAVRSRCLVTAGRYLLIGSAAVPRRSTVVSASFGQQPQK